MSKIDKKKGRKRKFVCELHLTYTFTYDPESKYFKDSLKDFNENIGYGGEQDMLCHVAHNVNQDGVDSMVEGVGYISFKGVYPEQATAETKSGIDTIVSYQKPDIDIISNDYI